MRIIVCGGRDFRDAKQVFEALDWLNSDYFPITLNSPGNITAIIHGDARGADSIADVWAVLHGFVPGESLFRCPAKWRENGVYNPQAGPQRNRHMAQMYRADLCLAFKGGSGTANMLHEAGRAGIEPMRWPQDRDRYAEPRLTKLMGERI